MASKLLMVWTLLNKYKYLALILASLSLVTGFYYWAKGQGVKEEHERTTRSEIQLLTKSIDGLTSDVHKLRLANDSLGILVNKSTVKIVTVDKNTVPIINTLLTDLASQLDSIGRFKLARLSEFYEDRIKVRDDDISALNKRVQGLLIERTTQDSIIAQQDTVIHKQQTLTSPTKHSFLHHAVRAIAVGGTIVVAFLAGKGTSP